MVVAHLLIIQCSKFQCFKASVIQKIQNKKVHFKYQKISFNQKAVFQMTLSIWNKITTVIYGTVIKKKQKSDFKR